MSVSVNVAERVPAAVGVKVMTSVQLPPAGATPPSVLHVVPRAKAKSPGLAPAFMEIRVKFKKTFPALLTVMLMGALVVFSGVAGKAPVVGFRPTIGSAAVAEPLSGSVCVPGAALSARVRLAVRLPAAVGVKITDSMQVPPPAATGV